MLIIVLCAALVGATALFAGGSRFLWCCVALLLALAVGYFVYGRARYDRETELISTVVLSFAMNILAVFLGVSLRPDPK